MPSTSEKQARLMRAVAHGWKKPGGGGPSKAVAKEFVAEDKKRKKFKGSTKAKVNNPDTRHGKLDMPFKSLKRFAGMAAGGDAMKAKNKGVRRMQDGGMTAPITTTAVPPARTFNTPTLPSQANARAATALGNRGMMGQPTVPPAPSDMAARANMGRGVDMRNIPTLPEQASQRARDMMAARLAARNPITTPGAPVEVLPEVAVLPPATVPAYKKGGRIKKRMAGGGVARGITDFSKKEFAGAGHKPGMMAGGKVPTAPTLPSQASSKAGEALSSRFAGGRSGMNIGGKVKRYAAGGAMPSAPTLPSQASSKASDAMSRFAGAGNRPGYKKGGMPKIKKYVAGGAVSKRADGCCMKGHTKGRMR